MRIFNLLIFILLFFGMHAQSKKDLVLDSLKNVMIHDLTTVEKNEDYLKAIPNLKNLANYTQSINDDFHWAEANIYIGYCFLLNKELDSLKHYGEIIENKIDQLTLADTSIAFINTDYRILLGKYYYYKGLYEQTANYYQEAIDIVIDDAGKDKDGGINYKKIGIHSSMNIHNLFNNTALIYEKFGDYRKAVDYYEMAVKLTTESDYYKTKEWRTTRKLSNMSFAHLNLGELNKAKQLIQKTEKLATKFNDKFSNETRGLIYRSAAYYHFLNNQQDSCQYYINKGLSLDTKDEFKVKIYHVYLQALNDEKSEKKIESVFDSLHTLSEKSIGYFHPDLAKGFKLKGDIYAYQAKYSKAEKDYNTAINILRNKKSNKCNCKDILIENLNDKRLSMEIIHSKAKSLSKSGKKKDALNCYQLLHQIIIELQQKYIMNEESKYFMIQKTKEIYESAIQNSVELGNKESAYLFSQSSRSLMLLQQVQDKNAIQATQIPKEILANGRNLKQQINIHLKEREEAILNGKTDRIEGIEKKLFSLNKQYEKWTKKLEFKYPEYYNLKYKLPEISLKTLKKKLHHKSTTLVEYFLGENQIFIFVINGDDIQIDVHDISSPFFKNIEIVFQSISQYAWNKASFDAYHQAAYSLFEKLLKPSIKKGWIKDKNLIIIPDEQLNLIPFEALIASPHTSNGIAPQYSKLDYLLLNYNISYLYSSHLINAKNGNNTSNSFLGIAPSFNNPDIAPLKNNVAEIEFINKLYNGKILLGTSATYQEFMKNIGQYNIAHFATHAVFNDDIPMDSRIEFADTSLYIYEIISLNHQLQLAVMSSCETASGKRKKGEGVISLSRAFIQSGCPSVVASLWEIPDNKAMDISSSFHKNLIQDKKRKDEALANAKREYLLNAINMNTHPFTWAGFIQIGDTSPIYASTYYFWHWIIGVLSLIIVLILFLKKIIK